MSEKYMFYYQKLFKKYPDIVGLPDFREMLGGLSEKCARELLLENQVKYFFICGRHGNLYKIPKEYVIDYILEESINERQGDYSVPPLKISRYS